MRRAYAAGVAAMMLGSLAATAANAQPARPPLIPTWETWWDDRDWGWYERNVPVFEAPDADITRTYWYRWEVVKKHMTYASPRTGYVFTEFIDRPFWSGAYGAISCPLGHQIYDLRWLADGTYARDYARYWFETPGAQPRSYSNWYGDAMWATYLVWGDTAFIRGVLPYMRRQYAGWVAERYDPARGLFRWDGLHDGMERNINSRQTEDIDEGAEGFRPTLNSYMYADAMAISHASALLGDSAQALAYRDQALALKRRVEEALWDPRREHFLHMAARDERTGVKAGTRTYETGKYAGDPHGRELIGYVPWQFSLPDSGYERAWRFLLDSAHFAAPFGPTTAERGDPQFFVSPTCCWWSGNAWPYATTQTLVAMANLLNDYRQDVVTRQDYVRLLRAYARTQRKGGRPYVAEAADPFTGSWEGHDTPWHSEHYFHSGFADLVVTGLVGLRPRADETLELNPLAPEEWPWWALKEVAYHGHRVSIHWDRDGRRYGYGKGLVVLVDGNIAARRAGVERVLLPLPERRPELRLFGDTSLAWVNFAVNNGRGAFPWVTASSGLPETPTSYLVDGSRWYHAAPANRWVSGRRGVGSDTLVLDFGAERGVEEVSLYFLDDGVGVRPPARYAVELLLEGRWQPYPKAGRTGGAIQGRRPESWRLPRGQRASASKVRVILWRRPGARVGLTELEAWGHDVRDVAEPTDVPSPNLAWGARASASFTGASDRVEQVNDMQVAFTRYSRNRWTAYGTPNTTDWVELDLGAPRTVGEVELYLYGDGRGVTAPRAYTVQYWDGADWTDARVRSRVPERPLASAVNVVRIAPVQASRVRVVLEHDRPGVAGITELIVR